MHVEHGKEIAGEIGLEGPAKFAQIEGFGHNTKRWALVKIQRNGLWLQYNELGYGHKTTNKKPYSQSHGITGYKHNANFFKLACLSLNGLILFQVTCPVQTQRVLT